GLESPRDHALGHFDLRAAGVQSFDAGSDHLLVFALNTFKAWSTPEKAEFDVLIDNDGDGNPDFDLFAVDFGLVMGVGFTGQYVAVILNLNTGEISADFLAVAPTDSSTVLLPVFAAHVGVTPDHPRFSYTAAAFDLFSDISDSFTATASFNAFTPAI